MTATAYVYDGWRCIEEWEATWPVGSTPSSPTYTLAAQYIHGGYIDELLVMRRDVDDNGALEEYFYHADDQFNIVAVTNASGTVVERYEYGPFGEPTILDPAGAVREESAVGNANLWNGREYDEETGLYYYRLRYLDPELGRFTTLDPIGLWGDPNNLGNGYAYVGNRPWTGLDPFGLLTWEGFRDGVISIPRGLAEPFFLVADIALAGGIAFGNATGESYIYAEDVHFSSGTANRLRQNIINGDGFLSHARAAAVTATAMPTGGGSVVFDNSMTAVFGGLSPEEADYLLSHGAGGQLGIAAIAKGLSAVPIRQCSETSPEPTRSTAGKPVDSTAGVEFLNDTLRMVEQPYRTPFWTSGRSASPAENTFAHWIKHRAEFPEIQNALQYAKATHKFVKSPPKGTLLKTRVNGDTLYYDPVTNTFAVRNANGAPRTMFRPSGGISYWNAQ